MEAMYLDKPIVASDIKGQRDLLPHSSLYTFNNLKEYINLVKNTGVEKITYDMKKYTLDYAMKENMEIYLKPLA